MLKNYPSTKDLTSQIGECVSKGEWGIRAYGFQFHEEGAEELRGNDTVEL